MESPTVGVLPAKRPADAFPSSFMESPTVGLLPAKRPADGFNSEKHKRSNVLDHSNPYAVADLIDGPNHGKFGSVTKDIESLIAQKMQTLSPIFAKDPALLQSAKVRMNCNEEAAKGCGEKIKLKHQNLKVEVMYRCFTILAALTCFGAILATASAMVVPSEKYWLLPVALVLLIACYSFIIVYQSLDTTPALTPVPSLGSSPPPVAPQATTTAPATTSARGCSQYK